MCLLKNSLFSKNNVRSPWNLGSPGKSCHPFCFPGTSTTFCFQSADNPRDDVGNGAVIAALPSPPCPPSPPPAQAWPLFAALSPAAISAVGVPFSRTFPHQEAAQGLRSEAQGHWAARLEISIFLNLGYFSLVMFGLDICGNFWIWYLEYLETFLIWFHVSKKLELITYYLEPRIPWPEYEDTKCWFLLVM